MHFLKSQKRKTKKLFGFLILFGFLFSSTKSNGVSLKFHGSGNPSEQSLNWLWFSRWDSTGTISKPPPPPLRSNPPFSALWIFLFIFLLLFPNSSPLPKWSKLCPFTSESWNLFPNSTVLLIFLRLHNFRPRGSPALVSTGFLCPGNFRRFPRKFLQLVRRLRCSELGPETAPSNFEMNRLFQLNSSPFAVSLSSIRLLQMRRNATSSWFLYGVYTFLVGFFSGKCWVNYGSFLQSVFRLIVLEKEI